MEGKKGRRVYCCRKCGQPKKGHVCTAAGETKEGEEDHDGLEQKRKVPMKAGRNTAEEEEEEEETTSTITPDYFVVLDLEATCDDNWNRDFFPQEIIEFSAVLYNADTQTEDSCQIYVKPIVHPVLTPFCKELTGIHQEWVDNGVSLSDCLQTFHEWLDRHDLLDRPQDQGFKPKTFWLATWSDWDLGTMLESQCLRTNVKKADYFNQWVDLKQLYMLYYSKKFRVKLADAVASLGLKWEGDEHCALDDCRNTGRLLGKMMDHGHPIIITSRISPLHKGC